MLSTYDRSTHISDALQRLMITEESIKKSDQAAQHRQLLTSLFPQSPAALPSRINFEMEKAKATTQAEAKVVPARDEMKETRTKENGSKENEGNSNQAKADTQLKFDPPPTAPITAPMSAPMTAPITQPGERNPADPTAGMAPPPATETTSQSLPQSWGAQAPSTGQDQDPVPAAQGPGPTHQGLSPTQNPGPGPGLEPVTVQMTSPNTE